MTGMITERAGRRGNKPPQPFPRPVLAGIAAGVLAAVLTSTAAAGVSPDPRSGVRNDGTTLPAWIVAVVQRELPPLESAKPELVQLAATTVPDEVLAELRGGFITAAGLELNIGFDFRTFINGMLVVRNLLNPTGASGGGASASSPPAPSPASVITVVSNGAGGAAQIINDVIAGAGNINVDNGDLPDGISNIVSSDGGGSGGSGSGDGTGMTMVTEITSNGGSTTQVINQVGGNGVGTTIINTANDLAIGQMNTTLVTVLNHSQFLTTIRTGRPVGAGPHMAFGLLGALVGAIQR